MARLDPYSHEDDLFGRLRAEREGAWLSRAFVVAHEFSALGGMRSVAIFGDSGAGKSALRQWLAASVNPPGQPQRLLLADWRPTLPRDQLGGSQAAEFWAAQALEASVLALINYLACHPQALRSAAGWVATTVKWFIHRHLIDMAGDRTLLLERFSEGAPAAGATLLAELLGGEPAPVFRPNTPEPKIIAALADVVGRLGLAGIWVMIDGLEQLVDEDPRFAAAMLQALLASLGLFEEQQVVLKLFVPRELEHPVMTSGAVSRRRIDSHWIHWTVPDLLAIVERRFALLLDRPAFALHQIYNPDELASTFERYGGRLPREWIMLARPIARAYIELGSDRPLTVEEWSQIWRSSPPPLRVDLDTHRVYIGQGEVANLQGWAQRLIEYLYVNRHRLCTRSELYFCGILGLPDEPRGYEDPGYTAPTEWEGLFNTSLWRLRNLIEDNPAKPIYIVTRRGKGIALEHAI